MEFISKYDITFIKFLNRKYSRKFKDFNDYAMFLFEIANEEEKDYYYRLEDDIKEYCTYQQERKYGDGKTKDKTKEPREESSTTRID